MDFKWRLMRFLGINLGIILVLGIALYFLGKDIGAAANQVIANRTEIASRNNIDEALANFSKDSAEAAKYKTDLNYLLPTTDQIINFPQDLTDIGKQNSVNLSTNLNEAGAGSEDSNLKKLNFLLTAQGKFDGLINTLKAIYTSRYTAKFSDLDMSRISADTYKITINGEVFSFNQ